MGFEIHEVFEKMVVFLTLFKLSLLKIVFLSL